MNAPLKKQVEDRIAHLERDLGVRGELRIVWTEESKWRDMSKEEREGFLRENDVSPEDDLRLILWEE